MKANDNGQLTTDKIPMTKEFLSPNDEGKGCELAGTIWSFVLRPSFDIRHSDFVIFQSFLTSRHMAKAAAGGSPAHEAFSSNSNRHR